MSHKFNIISVIVRYILQAIGKRLPLRKKLLKARKTAIHRVAARINDFSIGQNQADEADMAKIIGHFVGKKRRPLPVHARVFDKGLTISIKVFAAQIVQIGWVGASLSFA